jgi:hypothetical protein
MALPSSGTISASAIRTELQNTGKTNDFRLSYYGAPYALARDAGYVPVNQSSPSKPNTTGFNNSIPRPMSAWYSYNHVAELTCPIGFQSPDVSGGNYIYYRVNVSGVAGTYTFINLNLINPDIYTYEVRIYDTYPFTNLGAVTGTPISIGTGTFLYQLPASSNTLHFVFWNGSVV